MNITRTSRFLVKYRINILNTYRSTAKICTTVIVQKPETEIEEKPYPFISKLKEGKFDVKEVSDQDRKKYKNYQIRMVIVSGLLLSSVCYMLFHEPTEIDEAIDRMLQNKVPGFEEYELLIAIDKAKKNGLDTADLEAKLVEVRKKYKI